MTSNAPCLPSIGEPCGQCHRCRCYDDDPHPSHEWTDLADGDHWCAGPSASLDMDPSSQHDPDVFIDAEAETRSTRLRSVVADLLESDVLTRRPSPSDDILTIHEDDVEHLIETIARSIREHNYATNSSAARPKARP